MSNNKQRKDKIQYRSKNKKSHYYVILSSNGRVMATSENYSSERAAIKAVTNFSKKHPEFTVEVPEKAK